MLWKHSVVDVVVVFMMVGECGLIVRAVYLVSFCVPLFEASLIATEWNTSLSWTDTTTNMLS